MEGLNGHFSGWKRPSNWGPSGIDARTRFIVMTDRLKKGANSEPSSLSCLFQKILSCFG